MTVIGDFPVDEGGQGKSHQAPGVDTGNKDKRCEQKHAVPVVYATCCATPVFQEYFLEGTEKKDADHVANRIGGAYQNHYAVVKNTCYMQYSKDEIGHDPSQGNPWNCAVVLNDDIGFFRLHVVLCEMLLAPATLKTRRKESEHHFHDEYDPYHRHHEGSVFQIRHKILAATKVL